MSDFNPLQAIKTNSTSSQVKLIERYIDLLFRWNKKINLTSKHSSRERIYDFVCEGIAISRLIEDKNSIIVDVGSGAGFPGLILSILGYENINLVEARSKRTAFLSYVIAELKLPGRVHNCDVRDLTMNGVEYVLSKAVTSTESLVRLCKHIIGENTTIILCKNDQNHDRKVVQIADNNYRAKDYCFNLMQPKA